MAIDNRQKLSHFVNGFLDRNKLLLELSFDEVPKHASAPQIPQGNVKTRTVNHLSERQASASEKIVGRTIASLLLAFMVVGAGLLYLLNYPDEQVQNYAIKLVSVVFSIFAAVLLEKFQLNFVKRDLILVALHEHVAEKG
eukprot:CAMPEP_0115521768 /NCGR_PEP_ID=MMETSP0271-20121206/79724_1 /TAXON_ID=71861 /ORGANISM="Scrippsiella trochoidea, Strain CCMP3099" /LENGTH=139 /DNA_ID=CAMNT_0002953025 /DNA_START=86 /DNA_END=501 /DNA_ORIENTATION=-